MKKQAESPIPQDDAPSRRRGRPRQFDERQVLEQAMDVFIEKGYGDASVADLVEATGLKPPSLYAAFGNKEALFARALEHYTDHNFAWIQQTLSTKVTTVAAFEALFSGMVRRISDEAQSRGRARVCLLAQSGAIGLGESEQIVAQVNRLLLRREAIIRHRLSVGVEQGDLRADADLDALAQFFSAVLTGIGFSVDIPPAGERIAHIGAMAVRVLDADSID